MILIVIKRDSGSFAILMVVILTQYNIRALLGMRQVAITQGMLPLRVNVALAW